MTKIKNIEDLKVGDEVTVTVTGRISHVYPEDNYAQFDFEEHAEYISISDEYIEKGLMTVDRPTPPLPTKKGVYVPAANADTPEYSYLYLYNDTNGDGPWTVFDGITTMTGLAAKEEAERAHNYLGGLILLTARGSDE